jgi:hypothetical protein
MAFAGLRWWRRYAVTNRMEDSVKLTDTQLVLLSAASRPNASPFSIIFLRVLGQTDQQMIPAETSSDSAGPANEWIADRGWRPRSDSSPKHLLHLL